MRITVESGKLHQTRKGVKVIAALRGEKRPESLLPSSVRDAKLTALINKSGFRGSLNETLWLPRDNESILVVGLGKSKKLDLDRIRQFAAKAARVVRSKSESTAVLPVLNHKAVRSPESVAQATVEGVLLGLYRFDRYKQKYKSKKNQKLDSVVLIAERASDVAKIKKSVTKAESISAGVLLARDLINGPSNDVTPTYLANQAKAIARQYKLKCTVLPFAQLKAKGFGGIVGVAQGSQHPAQFIVLEYKPSGAKKTFAICGKGITFDTGGINLKPSAKMELMKYDMSGAAAVLGLMKAIGALKLPVHVVGIIAASENMPSGTAQKPGDILKTLSGITVEVLNTDAEGRLVLADCLHYAKRFKPECIIDLATLTGACVVALGSEAIGLMSNNDRVAARIEKAAEVTHERVWRLPMWDEYGQMVKSEIADLRNVTNTGEAGTITAGKFLEEFVGGLPWAHLDIAGTAWTDKDRVYNPKGAVGIGVRLLIEMLENWK